MSRVQLIQRLHHPGSPAKARAAIDRVLTSLPAAVLDLLVAGNIQVRALHENERYDEASPELTRIGVNVDGWPAPPAGLFVVEERTLYLRSCSPMTLTHELGHAVDLALGGGIYKSTLDPKMRREFSDATKYTSPYAATATDEWFAEGFRCYLSQFTTVNDAGGFWPKATLARLRTCAPKLGAFFESRFSHDDAYAMSAIPGNSVTNSNNSLERESDQVSAFDTAAVLNVQHSALLAQQSATRMLALDDVETLNSRRHVWIGGEDYDLSSAAQASGLILHRLRAANVSDIVVDFDEAGSANIDDALIAAERSLEPVSEALPIADALALFEPDGTEADALREQASNAVAAIDVSYYVSDGDPTLGEWILTDARRRAVRAALGLDIAQTLVA